MGRTLCFDYIKARGVSPSLHSPQDMPIAVVRAQVSFQEATMILLTVRVHRLEWLQGSLRVPVIPMISTTAHSGTSSFKSGKAVVKFLRKDCKEYRRQSSVERDSKPTHLV